jgi:hypothetical protein
VAQIDLAFEKLVMEAGDTFLMYTPPKASPEQIRMWLDRVQEWVDQRGQSDVRFIFVPKDFSLTRASEAEMRRLGWERIRT